MLEILRITGLTAQILDSCVVQAFAVIKQQEHEICSLKAASVKLKLKNMSICLTETCFYIVQREAESVGEDNLKFNYTILEAKNNFKQWSLFHMHTCITSQLYKQIMCRQHTVRLS